MSQITKIINEPKELTIAYKCDICGKEIKLTDYEIQDSYTCDKMATIKYMTFTGNMQGSQYILSHACSLDCVCKALKDVPFEADVKFTNDILQELVLKST